VVVNFIARAITAQHSDNLYFAGSLDEAAELAIRLSGGERPGWRGSDLNLGRFASRAEVPARVVLGERWPMRRHILASYLPKVYANAPINKELAGEFLRQRGAFDRRPGEDEFTVGRLHPMMDNEMRIRRLLEEADDTTVAVIMLDVVIGFGSHLDPASELAPAIAKAKAKAQTAGRCLEVVAVVTGTDEDPQNLNSQIEQLKAAGVWVETGNELMVRYAARLLRALNEGPASEAGEAGRFGNLQHPWRQSMSDWNPSPRTSPRKERLRFTSTGGRRGGNES
jgi:FdrA protein